MSIFTNAAGTAAAEGRAYTKALLDLLGERNPRAVQGETAGWLRSTLASLPTETLRRPEQPGKWSVVQVLRHLGDTEFVYGYRTRKAVAESGYTIVGYDQDRWAAELRYADADPGRSLDDFSALRAANLRWLDGLTAEEMERYGEHDERGRESVRLMTTLIAAHDLLHRAQITRILAAAGAPAAGR